MQEILEILKILEIFEIFEFLHFSAFSARKCLESLRFRSFSRFFGFIFFECDLISIHKVTDGNIIEIVGASWRRMNFEELFWFKNDALCGGMELMFILLI